MTNTQTRVVSGLVLTSVVAGAAFLGAKAVLILILIFGMICVDEVYCNFLKSKRFDFNYFLNQLFLMLPFLYFNLFSSSLGVMDLFINAALVLNFALIFYLFKIDMKSDTVMIFKKQFSILVGFFFLLPMMSLAAIIHYSKWPHLIWLLLLVNFGMDIGAWFFGRKFGKRKLWPSVSPNKTIEGFLGGTLVSATVGTFLWWSFFDKFNVFYILLFAILGALSQLGDLVESKFKRQSEIKDSSKLIPGHGGFYDRIDSLVFLSPFFATALRYIYF